MWPMLLWAKVTSKEAHSGEGGINGELYRVVPGPERRSGTCVGTTAERIVGRRWTAHGVHYCVYYSCRSVVRITKAGSAALHGVEVLQRGIDSRRACVGRRTERFSLLSCCSQVTRGRVGYWTELATMAKRRGRSARGTTKERRKGASMTKVRPEEKWT